MERRKRRTRNKIRKGQVGCIRLSVFRSNKHIYAQVINDDKGLTVAAASSLDKGLRAKKGSDVDSALAVGKLVAERALNAGVKNVIFDRGGYQFHGRVKALADAAREAGLSF
jgi:large subunit ribosomal protein L18